MINTYANKQSGAIHLVAIIIVVVVVLGGIGYLFWQNFMQPKDQSNSGQTSSTSGQTDAPKDNESQTPDGTITPTPAPTTSPQSPAQTAVYMSIKEWGVRFQLTGSLKSAGVQAKKVTLDVYPSGKYTYYEISTKRIRESDTQNNECDYGPVVSLDRFTKKKPKGEEGSSTLVNKTAINGYYFYTVLPSASPCEGTADTDALLKAIQTLEAIPAN